MKKGFFSRLKHELFKTRQGPISAIRTTINKKRIATREELEETLILSDVGVKATGKIISSLEKRKIKDPDLFMTALKEEMATILTEHHKALTISDQKPYVIMVVGVNGSGKTTTIGKLAHNLVTDGKKVLVAAADTFRAAAVHQIEEWCKRSGADIISGGGNPSAVIFDAVKTATSKNYDVLIIDTAGRLQNKNNLMEELKKMERVIKRDIENAPHETLLVIDATTGQNAISQARNFNEATKLTGLVLTKIDGTAKGGVVIQIVDEMRLPVKLIGCGEKIDDLMDFEPKAFIDAIFDISEDNENSDKKNL